MFWGYAVNLATLPAAQPSVLLLRDGELVLYRRTRSLMYQCRFKLTDGNPFVGISVGVMRAPGLPYRRFNALKATSGTVVFVEDAADDTLMRSLAAL